MKVIIVGASGRIGSKITEALSKEHEIIRVKNDAALLRPPKLPKCM
jgi:putative NADH-flavin reductase